jgi:hypothetical protein
MASSVDIELPSIGIQDGDFLLNGVDYSHHSYSDMPAELLAKIKARAKWAAKMTVAEILARAFPQHDDRSDSMTDSADNRRSARLPFHRR